MKNLPLNRKSYSSSRVPIVVCNWGVYITKHLDCRTTGRRLPADTPYGNFLYTMQRNESPYVFSRLQRNISQNPRQDLNLSYFLMQPIATDKVGLISQFGPKQNHLIFRQNGVSAARCRNSSTSLSLTPICFCA